MAIVAGQQIANSVSPLQTPASDSVRSGCSRPPPRVNCSVLLAFRRKSFAYMSYVLSFQLPLVGQNSAVTLPLTCAVPAPGPLRLAIPMRSSCCEELTAGPLLFRSGEGENRRERQVWASRRVLLDFRLQILPAQVKATKLDNRMQHVNGLRRGSRKRPVC